ncbi:hypothetical protein DPMN_060181 [Dreissena polymorpha]|uniref:Uncharacterized protein n=1 Tax=Dreissena polymorpha TaxID=45954 RepID=A0A9D4HFM7_DREPO|nr:hypothetical protein DPMN_060181 [Dreissena polymorpha]
MSCLGEEELITITTDLNNTCAFDIWNDSPGLWGTLWAFLPQLETLKLPLSVNIDLQLPPSLKHLTVSYYVLSPAELRQLVNQLCVLTHSVVCKVEFLCGNKIENTITNIPSEENIPIKHELEALDHVEVKRFRIYDQKPDIT